MSDFEDDYFEHEDITTSAARPSSSTIAPPGPALKAIDRSRKRQAIGRQMGRRLGDTGATRQPPPPPPTLRTPKIMGIADLQAKQVTGGAGGATTTPLDINVTITKEHEKTTPPAPSPHDNKHLKYQVSKYVDQNRDLYFIKIVAGSLKRPFESLINVEKENNQGIDLDGKVIVNIKYNYSTELLFAWSTIIEKVKLMVEQPNMSWKDTESVHFKLINNDTTCVSFARYVSFIIMKESNSLVPMNRTRYVIDQDGIIEDRLTVDLMRAIENEYSVLRDDLKSRFL